LYCGMSAESQNCEASRDSHCKGMTLQTSITRLQRPKQTPVTRQWLSKCHVTAATLMYATVEELLEGVFSAPLMARPYNGDQLLECSS
jgi:hypothetical protein